MQLIRGLYNLPENITGHVAAIGNFDGIHIGHQKILRQLRKQAKKSNLPSLVILFEPQPQEFFDGENAPARLTSLRDKLQLLQQFAIDRVLCLRFDQQLASLSAQSFVSDILLRKLHLKWLIVGEDFRFGYQKQGGFVLLEQLAQVYGFYVARAANFLYHGQRVSSSWVRETLAQGDLAMAAQLLGRTYTISGRVFQGDQRGRLLGFPTANLALRQKNLPLQGVFTVQVTGVDSAPWPGVANVGRRPTVDGKTAWLEVYLLDFDQNIYKKHLKVSFLHKLRDEQRFSSVAMLKQQIVHDVAQARTLLLPSNLR